MGLISFAEISKYIDEELLNNKSMLKFFRRGGYEPGFDPKDFIGQSLKKTNTRRMMLRLYWYVSLAEKIYKIEKRPALGIVYLFAAAEGIEKVAVGKDSLDSRSRDFAFAFFEYILVEDKKELIQKFRRADCKKKYHKLRFSSILKILWNARCNAVHGREFWSLALFSGKRGWSVLTSGELGRPNRKRREMIDTKLTFADLVSIFVRTGIKRIKSEF